MVSRNRPNCWKGLATMASALVLVCLTGCHSTCKTCDLVFDGSDRISTPSVENAREATVEVDIRHRPFKLTRLTAMDGTVTHSPLFYEDPFETPGDDFTFHTTWLDYFHLVYGPIRYLASTALYPVSAIVTPPWQLVESDGQLAKPTDSATRNSGSQKDRESNTRSARDQGDS